MGMLDHHVVQKDLQNLNLVLQVLLPGHSIYIPLILPNTPHVSRWEMMGILDHYVVQKDLQNPNLVLQVLLSGHNVYKS